MLPFHYKTITFVLGDEDDYDLFQDSEMMYKWREAVSYGRGIILFAELQDIIAIDNIVKRKD